ncbi:MAG TPA: M48 family metalloprotease [Chthoniobacterales bacterium]|nr:M48 family metalloprotease [Chthoniobacterales bacterium]
MHVGPPTPGAEGLNLADGREWTVRGSVPPAPVSLLYKIGLAAVAVMMVLLPIVYLAIIAAAGYAVYDHAADPWFNLEIRGLWSLLAYLTPVTVGIILVFFMIKPLFARRIKSAEPVPVTADEEPELFRFIETVCDLVRAPRPKRVLLDLQVNASASFRRGLLSLLGRDLTLTIGLPLVAGLNVRELGGVLAHEFGHFAQGAGMRLTFVVRTVNAWFARLVYERDAWDDRLRNAAGRADFRIAIILQLARGMIWLTRRILWALMTIGHGISCFMLRQMELDADRFETEVAGTQAFASTTRRLHLLNVASQRTLGRQQDAFLTKRLVDNLPGLVALETKRLPAGVEKSVEEALVTSKTGWFDTHPSDRDRVQASQALAAPGVLTGDAPAAALFRDFAATAQKRTESYYRDECGIELKEICLYSLDDMSSEAQAAAEEEESVSACFGPLLTVRTLITIAPEDLAHGAAAPTREVHAQLLEDAKPSIEALLQADSDELSARNAGALLDAGFAIKHKEFGLKKGTRDAADEAIADAKSRVERERANLSSASEATRQRMAEALAGDASSAAHSEARSETRKLVAVLGRFERIADTLVTVRNSTAGLELLLVNAENAANGNLWNIAARELNDATERAIDAVINALGEFNYPFPHARGVVPLSEFLTESEPHEQRIPRAFLRGRAVLERSLALHYRIVGRLAVLARHAQSRRAGV